MYYVALDEWGLAPEYLNEQWTPEILFLMFRERKANIKRLEADREQRLNEMAGDEDNIRREVSDLDLFKKMKIPGYVS